MDWIEANGLSLRYALEGEGPLLVLIHEIGGCLESWDGIAPTLSRRFRVLRYDQRTAGLSEKPPHPFTLDDLTDDLDALLRALDLPAPYHLLGAAMGAAQAIMLADRRPDAVASLALLNPATDLDPSRATFMQERSRRAAEEGIRAVLPMTLERAWPNGAQAGNAYHRYRARYLANDPHGFALQNQALLSVDVGQAISRLHIPTLVLAGHRDAVRPPEMVRSFAARISGSTFDIIDAAHFMAAEAPAPVLARLALFHDQVLQSDTTTSDAT